MLHGQVLRTHRQLCKVAGMEWLLIHPGAGPLDGPLKICSTRIYKSAVVAELAAAAADRAARIQVQARRAV